MDLKPITPDFTVSPQIGPADVAAAARLGFRVIINNRPDGEDAGQPSSAEIEAAARALGLDYRHIPVAGGHFAEADIAAFAAAREAATGPVLAYCRSGTRCTILWALAEARRTEPGTLIAAAAAAGYDLNVLRPSLESRFLARDPSDARDA